MATVVPQFQGKPSSARTVRAMAKTGTVSAACALLSVITMKILAVALGPAHIALWVSLQQLRQIGLTFATLGGQTALIQGASELSGATRQEFVRTVALLTLVGTALSSMALVFAPVRIAEFVGLGPGAATAVRWMAPVVGFGAAGVFLTSLLATNQNLNSLVTVQLVGAGLLALLAYPFSQVTNGGNGSWLSALLCLSSVITVAAASLALRHGERLPWERGSWWNPHAARRFFMVTGSMLASGLLSHWALVTVRSRILHQEGMQVGGQFDAAWAISMNQVGLVLASLQSYYLPAVAGETTPEARGEHIRRMLTATSLAAAGLVAALTILKPLILWALYSHAFTPATRFLRWTLAGDYLKVSSSILSTSLIATRDMRGFLATDLSAYGTFVGVAWLLTRGLGVAEATAAAFVAMYAVHLIVCGTRLHLSHEFRVTRSVFVSWLGGAGTVLLTTLLFWEQ